MIKVIDGKRYNTDTAEEVYSYWNGCGRTDFRFRTKKLFRTRYGAWFLHHEGGAGSDMAVSCGSNSMSGSSDIEPIDDDDAFGFLQAHSDDSEALAAIDEYFADRITDA